MSHGGLAAPAPLPRWMAWAWLGVLAYRLMTPGHSPAADDAWLAALLSLLGAGVAGARSVLIPRRVFVGLATFLGLSMASSQAALSPGLSWLAAPALWTPFAVFLGVLSLEPRDRERVVTVIALAGCASALVGLYQVAYAWPALAASDAAAHLPAAMASRLHSARALGLSLSPDLGGALALGGLAACASLVLRARQRVAAHRHLATYGGALCLLGVALARSAGVALAGALAGVLLAGLHLGPRVASLPRQRRRGIYAALGLASVAAVAAAVATFGRGPEALARSASERVWNWAVALEAFREAPLLGHGVGRFASAYAHHQLPGANLTRYAHSLPLHALVELGLLGVVALLVWALLVWRWRAQHMRAGDADPPHLPLLAGCAALWWRCAYDYDAQVAQGAALLAAYTGLVLSARTEAPAPSSEVATAHTSHGQLPLRIPLLVLSALSLAVSVPALWRDAAMQELREGARTSDDATAALRRYARAFPSDEHAAVMLFQQDLAAALACTGECAARFRALEARAIERCALPGAPPPFFVAAVRLAAGRGDLLAARARLSAGLHETPGDPALRALDVTLAEDDGRAQAARAEALRWLTATTLEEALAALR